METRLASVFKKIMNSKLYKVYNPDDDSRSTFDSTGIRNIMLSYFIGETTQDVYDNIIKYIESMPDKWVIEFLENQEDTVVEPASNDMHSFCVHEPDEEHGFDDGW